MAAATGAIALAGALWQVAILRGAAWFAPRGHNVFAATVALVGGRWIDRAGPGPVFATGAAVYVAAYVAFALPIHAWFVLLIAFTLAGSGIGLAEAAESTLVARLLPDHLHCGGFGVLGALRSFGGLAASAVVGLLWVSVSPAAGFVYAARLAGALGRHVGPLAADGRAVRHRDRRPELT